jgi:prepilin-type N-terminal cleavage/methylation domain-containing protein
MTTKRGFTLTELIVVVGIIALLASIILSSLGAAKSRGSDVGKTRALAEVRNALNVYFNDTTGGNGSYPLGNLAALNAALVPKYIGSIDPNIKYQSLNTTNTICSTGTCLSYHLAIALTKTDNKVLTSDRDFNDTVIDGTKDTCATGGGTSIPDLCYDIMPN